MPNPMEMILDLLVNRPQANATRGVHFPGGQMQQDIPLPMPPGGQVDPMLPPEPPDVLGAMGKAAGGYRSIRDSLAGMERARDAAGNQKRKRR